MDIFTKQRLKYNDLLKDTRVPLMLARIRILAFGLILLMILTSLILGLLLLHPPNPVVIARLSFLLFSLAFAFYLLIYKEKWKISGHILLGSLCFFIWTTLVLYEHGMNLVTFQLILIVVSSGFYILGKNWGIIYALGSILPVLGRLFLTRVQPGAAYISNVQVHNNTFMLALIGNFILLIVMHYEFFKSFYQSQRKERELNAQLQLALNEAQDATRMRTNFLSSMSHELRTPLHAVIGMINLLSLENPRKDQEDNLAILRFSAENLMALINDTLDFSKMNDDKIVLNKAGFNLDLLLQNIYAAFHAKAEQKEIGLHLKMDNEHNPLILMGDQTRLTQILNNLISNAIKFTDPGGKVEMSIQTLAYVGNSVSLLFKVSDTGIGIPKNKQSIIFEPFLQADNNIAKRYGGTGLGLAIVKKLVSLHDSTLKLHSEENKGSIFSFEIKYELADEKGTVPEQAPAVVTAIDISELRILIAEDNVINVMVIKKILDQWGCHYSIANNGLEALEMVKTGAFDVVLMDIHMPVMDGFEAAREIREIANVKISQIKIIALTASSDVDIQQSFSFTYLDDYLTKPFSPALLKEKLEAVVKISQA